MKVLGTVKALLSPSRGAYLISGLPDGGLIERGLIRDKNISSSFSVLLFHILQNQHTIYDSNT